VSRKAILIRDNHQCQYCGLQFAAEQLELEHVLPRSRGGQKTWENIVAACRPCNKRKADCTPIEAGMTLIRRPMPATVHTTKAMLRTLGLTVNGWSKYLWHDNNGESHLVVRGEAVPA
jgi:5-methylcytosine-specific restriction endonuclease McrA